MKTPRPSDLELRVLAVLWDRGPSTVRDVLESLRDGKKRAYTTVLSVIQGMEAKGLVTHDRDGLTHVYRAKVQKRQVLGPLMREMVTNLFGGRPAEALQFMLGPGKVSPEELAQIRELIDKAHAAEKPGKEKTR